MMRLKNSVLGFAIGDAMGVPLKFMKRSELACNPVTKMVTGSFYDVPKGTWSSYTSMTLATIDSIVRCHGIDYKDMMDRFCMYLNKNKYTALGEVFDVDKTTRESLLKYYNLNVNPLECGKEDECFSDNGSLMRMLPVALYTYYGSFDDDELISLVRDVSSLTHANEVSVMGCFIYVKYVHLLLSGYDKYKAYQKLRNLNYYKFSIDTRRHYKRLLSTDISLLDVDYINSTNCVFSCLEASIWVFLNTNSFMEAIIGAINLGDDTDSVGAIVGSLAGLCYSVPMDLFNEIQNRGYLMKMASKFDEELRLNILKFDFVCKERYGVVRGSDVVFLMKTGTGEDIYGYHNKYLKLAKQVNYKYGVTAIVINGSMDILSDLSFLGEYAFRDIYFMGMGNSAMEAIQCVYDNPFIKRMLLINGPLTKNLHKTKMGIENYKGELTFVYGGKDQSCAFLPLIQDYSKIKIVVIKEQDHYFCKGDDILALPDKYLFYDMVRREVIC